MKCMNVHHAQIFIPILCERLTNAGIEKFIEIGNKETSQGIGDNLSIFLEWVNSRIAFPMAVGEDASEIEIDVPFPSFPPLPTAA